jgi:hypothetical protein
LTPGSRVRREKLRECNDYQEDADMKMRKRKRMIYLRLFIGLQVAALIAELENMAEELRGALKESDPQYAKAEVEV